MNHKFKNVVAETLLIPLYMRAKESRRENPILKDDAAVRLAESFDYDYSKFEGAKLSEVGCVVRGWYFDNAVRRFIASHDRPVVVNVGCGLDTRYQRVGGVNQSSGGDIQEPGSDQRYSSGVHDGEGAKGTNSGLQREDVGQNSPHSGKAMFYDMDLPEVIEIRRKLLPESPENSYIPGSLLETDWMDVLKDAHPDSQFIFVVEGVLMYFYEDQVRSFLHNIASRFSGGELWFDVCGTIMTRCGAKPDSLRDHDAQIRCGISDAHQVERWEPGLQLIEQANYMKFFRPRWGFFFGQILGRITRLCYGFSSMLGYRIK